MAKRPVSERIFEGIRYDANRELAAPPAIDNKNRRSSAGRVLKVRGDLPSSAIIIKHRRLTEIM